MSKAIIIHYFNKLAVLSLLLHHYTKATAHDVTHTMALRAERWASSAAHIQESLHTDSDQKKLL